MPRKKTVTHKKEFIIINSDLKYFSGLENGGRFRWTNEHSRAKPLDDIRKFEWMKKNCHEEIMMDWIKN